jgi:hypothetical protein
MPWKFPFTWEDDPDEVRKYPSYDPKKKYSRVWSPPKPKVIEVTDRYTKKEYWTRLYKRGYEKRISITYRDPTPPTNTRSLVPVGWYTRKEPVLITKYHQQGADYAEAIWIVGRASTTINKQGRIEDEREVWVLTNYWTGEVKEVFAGIEDDLPDRMYSTMGHSTVVRWLNRTLGRLFGRS